MTQKYVLMDQGQKGITQIILNRPEKRNALNLPLIEMLDTMIQEVVQKPDQRVIVIRGEGSAFCTGLDLSETGETKNTERIGRALARLFMTIFTAPLVTIAAVQGYAIAGGAGIASACDIIIAERNTKFGFPEVRRGLISALVSTFLKRQISERYLRELFLLGELISAERAHEIGLINRLVEDGGLMEEVTKCTQSVLKGAPAAIVETKRLLEEMYPGKLTDDMNCALVYHKQSRTHFEAQEGIKAFLEDRKPEWDLS